LANAGARVLIAARDERQLRTAARSLQDETGASIFSLAVDLSDQKKTTEFAAQAIATLGRVDIFVGNAGTERLTHVDGLNHMDMDAIFDLNTTANLILTSAFAATMAANAWGRVIYVSSVVASVSSDDGHGVYAASKAALECYARTAAVELGPNGITVNCIAPGVYLTDLPKERFALMSAETAKKVYNSYADMTALGRWGDPVELEGPLLLLASDAGSYITGTVMHVDGGLSIRMRPRSRSGV
jgi:NAD(P)-dependent dehydrogenase (short-subunit alcohol dehydrogenase family)